MPDNIQDLDLKDELIVGRKVGFFKKPSDMSPMTYKIITNIDKFSLFIGKLFLGLSFLFFYAWCTKL